MQLAFLPFGKNASSTKRACIGKVSDCVATIGAVRFSCVVPIGATHFYFEMEVRFMETFFAIVLVVVIVIVYGYLKNASIKSAINNYERRIQSMGKEELLNEWENAQKNQSKHCPTLPVGAD